MNFFWRLRLCVFVLLCGISAATQAQTFSPVSSIFNDKGELGLTSVQNVARAQSAATPYYKSNGVETRWYEGYFRATSSNSKLALLSDDGTSVWIDGAQVLDRAGKTQGFEGEGTHTKNGVTWQNGFAATFSPLSKTFSAGQTYHLKLQYTNTIHSSDADVDGVSLWAYDGGGDIVPNPNLEVTISFPDNKYFVGTQQNANITLSGPSDSAGPYTVHVTGPGTDTNVSLRIGGAPGGNTGTATINIPLTTGNATYTAKVTIKGTPVEGSATVEAADIVAKITQSDATPNPADVGQEVTINLDAALVVPSGVTASTPIWTYSYGSFRYREDENSPWSEFSPGGSYLELDQSSPNSSKATYKGSFFSAGQYEVEITVTATFTINGQQVTRQASAFAGK